MLTSDGGEKGAMILADNETKVDLLNNEAIAKTIIELLREKPERAVTIGVHGDWGAGKSSILEMIEHGLSPDEDVLCIKFNGWRFQDRGREDRADRGYRHRAYRKASLAHPGRSGR